MTDDEILSLAALTSNEPTDDEMIAFARAIAAKERDACAAIVDAEMEENEWESNANVVLNNVAAAIRARGGLDANTRRI